MADPRHPEDTLFFVAEADFRVYEADCWAREHLREQEHMAERRVRLGQLAGAALWAHQHQDALSEEEKEGIPNAEFDW
eukprot:13897891-Alexandrium_andersonii.AAC.1